MKTVKVRIGVSVNKYGEWWVVDATGGGKQYGPTDDEIRERFEESDPTDDEILHFVTFEVPVPESTEIAGVAEPDPAQPAP